jgi:hypothetical protein
LTKRLASCPLSDLTDVQICVGGICKADLSANSIVRGRNFPNGASTYKDGGWYQGFRFRIAGTGCLYVGVGPFPFEGVFNRDISAEDMTSFLSQELAVAIPLLSVTFTTVCFYISGVHGAIRNLIPAPEIEEGSPIRRTVAAYAAAAENGVEDDTGVEGDVEGQR